MDRLRFIALTGGALAFPAIALVQSKQAGRENYW